MRVTIAALALLFTFSVSEVKAQTADEYLWVLYQIDQAGGWGETPAHGRIAVAVAAQYGLPLDGDPNLIWIAPVNGEHEWEGIEEYWSYEPYCMWIGEEYVCWDTWLLQTRRCATDGQAEGLRIIAFGLGGLSAIYKGASFIPHPASFTFQIASWVFASAALATEGFYHHAIANKCPGNENNPK